MVGHGAWGYPAPQSVLRSSLAACRVVHEGETDAGHGQDRKHGSQKWGSP
jgi:hypothetical protein